MFWFAPVLGLLVLVPAVRLLRRAGLPGISALLLLVPVVNLVFLWWLAFGRAGGSMRHRLHHHRNGDGPRRCGPGGPGSRRGRQADHGDSGPTEAAPAHAG